MFSIPFDIFNYFIYIYFRVDKEQYYLNFSGGGNFEPCCLLCLPLAVRVNYIMGFVILIFGFMSSRIFSMGILYRQGWKIYCSKKKILLWLLPVALRNFVLISQFEGSQTTEYKFKPQAQSDRRPSLVSALFLASYDIPYVLMNSFNHLNWWLFYFIQYVQVLYRWHIFRFSNLPYC